MASKPSTPVGTPAGRAHNAGTPSSLVHSGWPPSQAVGSTSPTPTTSSPLSHREGAKLAASTSPTPTTSSPLSHREGAKPARSTEDDALFEMFSAALAKSENANLVCQQMLPRAAEPDFQVSWDELQELNPLQTLAHAVACTLRIKDQPIVEIHEKGDCQKLQEWWRALLARHGLYGCGDTVNDGELREIVVAAIRMLRDRYACMAYLRNQRTVPKGEPRLKDWYASFEFISRGSHGKTYKCRSRLTREEHICRQIRKDRIKAPVEHVRSELDSLRNIDHPNLLQVTGSFEDFNSIYIVLVLVEGVELVQFLQQRHASGKSLTESWFAEVIHQVLQALRRCHELQPRRIVHGDLRISSINLASISDAESAPHAIIADLGLAGMSPQPPPLPRLGQGPAAAASATARLKLEAANAEAPSLAQPPSPKLDIWSCGCLIFMLLAGRHPFGCDDLGASLLPPVREVGVASTQPDWSLLGHVSQNGRVLCSKMLHSEAKQRPTAAACLADPWFARLGPLSAGQPVPLERLASLMQLHARSKFRQVVTNLVVSELSDSPFSCAGAALAVMGACGDKGRCLVSVPELTAGLQQLGVSSQGIEKVVRAFDPDASGSVEFSRLSSGCAELAEDLLDHALWRVFTAAGEDHRGVLGSAELEQALQDRGERACDYARPTASSEQACGSGPVQKNLGPEIKASEIMRQLAHGGNEVTFEELKDMVILRQSAAYVAALSEGLPSTSL